MGKTCSKCTEHKELDGFHKSQRGRHGRAAWCKSCFKKYYKGIIPNGQRSLRQFECHPVSDSEAWVAVSSCPAIEASSEGRVRYAANKKLLTGFKHSLGYLSDNFYVNGKRYNRWRHSIIAEAFLGVRPTGLVINHKDGNKCNNVPTNLEYITQAENVAHAVRLGLHSSVKRRLTA